MADRLRDSPDLEFWLENMIVHHGYSIEETAQGLGTTVEDVRELIVKFEIDQKKEKEKEKEQETIKVLPWAPGRHPRIGFLDGAIDPQRDTKISIFLPWENAGYVVFDLPEAVFSNLGLIYLAHTHVPTVWTEKNVTLDQIDWQRNPDGTLESRRALPNKITFGAKVFPLADAVEFEYWLENNTDETLTGLRNQLCLMLKNAPDFNAQTADNKLLLENAAAVKSRGGRRWIVTQCDGAVKPWQNPPVPCIHADPTFPDCPPGQRVSVRGKIAFLDDEAMADFRKNKETRKPLAR